MNVEMVPGALWTWCLVMVHGVIDKSMREWLYKVMLIFARGVGFMSGQQERGLSFSPMDSHLPELEL